jgi:subtilisin family serine protease
MMIVYIASSGSTSYNLRVMNATASQKRIEGMLGDDGFSWIGLARWSAPTENNTATWPSTADSAIGVAAYKSKSNNTDINTFSGRGARIDGARTVDVAAPGSTVYSIGLNTTYTAFGGTSSAGPHVAGAAALILQADTTLRHRDVRRLLRTGAIADQYTGTVPNTTWGFGKLRINNSLGFITSTYEEQHLPSLIALDQNYPNPFNPTTTIRYSLPSQSINSAQGRAGVGSHVTLKVYDVLGREVATLVNEVREPGMHTVQWNAAGLASGVYFYRIQAGPPESEGRRRAGGFTATKKLLLLK